MKHKLKFIISLLILIPFLTACGTTVSDTMNYSADQSYENDSPSFIDDAPYLDYNGSITQETINYDAAKSNLVQVIKEHGLKIQQQEEYRNSIHGDDLDDGLMDLTMVLKVKREYYTEVYQALQDLDQAVLVSSNLGKEDREEEVVSAEKRLERTEEEIEVLTKQLEDTTEPEEKTRLNSELKGLRDEKYQILDEIDRVKEDVRWGTIYYQLREREQIGNEENAKFTTGAEIKRAFDGVWSRTKHAFEYAIIFILNSTPYLLVLLVLAILWRYILRPVLGLLFPKKTKKKENPVKIHRK